MRRGPGAAGLDQFLGRLIVPGHEHCGLLDRSQHVDADGEIAAHIAQITGTHQYVDKPSTLDQTPGRTGARVQVTE